MRKPSPATVIATAALFVSLGGTTYAAANLPRNSVGTRQLRNGAVTKPKLHRGAVNASKVVPNSLTGDRIDESTLGTVPRSADANQLGGAAASSYRDACPSGMRRVPSGDICFDADVRREVPFAQALATCAQAHLRLASPAELAQIFDSLGAPQDSEWVADWWFSGTSTQYAAGTLGENDSRVLDPNGYDPRNPSGYRCVTTVSNS